MPLELTAFDARFVEGVMRLLSEEGWPSLASDRDRALRVLTAPGARTVVAVDDGQVVGFAHALTDGEVTAYLSLVLVNARHRRTGLGRRLIEDVFRRCGAERMDLLSTEGSDGFYETFVHRRFPGFRIYP